MAFNASPATVVVASTSVSSKVGVGFSTYAGLIATILQAAGAVYAGVKANDTLAVTAGVGAIATALTTLGGRFAQAVALVRKAAPIVQNVAAGLDTPDPQLDDPDFQADPIATPRSEHVDLGDGDA